MSSFVFDFTEEFEILCESYIGKHNNYHNKNSELEIIKKFAKEQEFVVTKSDKGNDSNFRQVYIFHYRISIFQ